MLRFTIISVNQSASCLSFVLLLEAFASGQTAIRERRVSSIPRNECQGTPDTSRAASTVTFSFGFYCFPASSWITWSISVFQQRTDMFLRTLRVLVHLCSVCSRRAVTLSVSSSRGWRRSLNATAMMRIRLHSGCSTTACRRRSSAPLGLTLRCNNVRLPLGNAGLKRTWMCKCKLSLVQRQKKKDTNFRFLSCTFTHLPQTLFSINLENRKPVNNSCVGTFDGLSGSPKLLDIKFFSESVVKAIVVFLHTHRFIWMNRIVISFTQKNRILFEISQKFLHLLQDFFWASFFYDDGDNIIIKPHKSKMSGQTFLALSYLFFCFVFILKTAVYPASFSINKDRSWVDFDFSTDWTMGEHVSAEWFVKMFLTSWHISLSQLHVTSVNLCYQQVASDIKSRQLISSLRPSTFWTSSLECIPPPHPPHSLKVVVSSLICRCLLRTDKCLKSYRSQSVGMSNTHYLFFTLSKRNSSNGCLQLPDSLTREKPQVIVWLEQTNCWIPARPADTGEHRSEPESSNWFDDSPHAPGLPFCEPTGPISDTERCIM